MFNDTCLDAITTLSSDPEALDCAVLALSNIHPDLTETAIERYLMNKSAIVYKDLGEVVAILVFNPFVRGKINQRIIAWTKQEYRKQGLQKRLTILHEQMAVTIGVPSIELTVHMGNEEAQAMVIGLGYMPAALVYEKKLDGITKLGDADGND